MPFIFFNGFISSNNLPNSLKFGVAINSFNDCISCLRIVSAKFTSSPLTDSIFAEDVSY